MVLRVLAESEDNVENAAMGKMSSSYGMISSSKPDHPVAESSELFPEGHRCYTAQLDSVRRWMETRCISLTSAAGKALSTVLTDPAYYWSPTDMVTTNICRQLMPALLANTRRRLRQRRCNFKVSEWDYWPGRFVEVHFSLIGI
ncbi:hypothetical protein T265_10464 [Opisthorchis viverrini]|uniref:Uncharacterized protein n=1 Tax=Opisthorchis viverrini TaxID=6198 RepID=A0A074Z254_OPIVI|nr:hypothetical protein T265_10464 [Opisthorchis viverrini]KER21131.1 hypothetical protein T265_10464 [Opisthorchis viverrini]